MSLLTKENFDIANDNINIPNGRYICIIRNNEDQDIFYKTLERFAGAWMYDFEDGEYEVLAYSYITPAEAIIKDLGIKR